MSRVGIISAKVLPTPMKPFPVHPMCLSCHGTAENIPDNVRGKLAVDYPHDQATGYTLGEVRGTVSIKQPIESAQ